MRDKLIFKIALETGLRISDILHLKRADVFKQKFTVVERKTKKKKSISLSADTVNLARAYDKIYHVKRKKFLFVSTYGGRNKPLTRQTEYYHYKKIAKILNAHTACHSTRQTFAKKLLKETGDIKKVMKALNHSSEKITKQYLKRNHRIKKEL